MKLKTIPYLTILMSISILSCSNGNNEVKKEGDLISEKPTVFYGVNDLNFEDTFSIYSPDFHEKIPNWKTKIDFFFENDTLKFLSSIFGFYEGINLEGFIINNRMTFLMEFNDCESKKDSMIIQSSEIKFANKEIKPNENYLGEFNIHVTLYNEYDSMVVYVCGTSSGIVNDTVPENILRRREFEKEHLKTK